MAIPAGGIVMLTDYNASSVQRLASSVQLIFPGTVNSNIAINIGTSVVMSSDVQHIY